MKIMLKRFGKHIAVSENNKNCDSNLFPVFVLSATKIFRTIRMVNKKYLIFPVMSGLKNSILFKNTSTEIVTKYFMENN